MTSPSKPSKATSTEVPESSYENGHWFLSQSDKVLHRTQPKQGYIFQLNTIESEFALHDGPDHGGNWHSAMIVNEDNLAERGGSMERRCPICFPGSQS